MRVICEADYKTRVKGYEPCLVTFKVNIGWSLGLNLKTAHDRTKLTGLFKEVKSTVRQAWQNVPSRRSW
jgi:hypothetical protein